MFCEIIKICYKFAVVITGKMKKFTLIIVFFTLIIAVNSATAQVNTQNIKLDTFNKYTNPHIGTIAPDFRYIISENDTVFSLHNLVNDSIILLFYSINCSHCTKEIKKLRKNKILNSKIDNNNCILLTIPPDASIDEWKEYVNYMPKNWINAYCLDNDSIISNYLWKVPQVFSIDKNKCIIHVEMFSEYD